MKATTELPDDPALPGLAAIRTAGVARAIPALAVEGGCVELALCGYTRGERATLEVRTGDRRLAVKLYAGDPAPEAELYEALAAGFADGSGVRVPPLLAWDRELRMLVLGWLEGPTAHQLVKGGQGARAGALAARWLERAASLRVRLGPPVGAARMLAKAEESCAALRAADAGLGSAATALVEHLARTQRAENARFLVHGTLYDRHILDLADGPGVIDWQRFGQGPLELDAGVFLATISRIALRHEPLSGEVQRVEEAFRAGTRDLLDERALAWHRAATLVRFAAKPVLPIGAGRLQTRRKGDARALALGRARALLDEGTRILGAVR